MKELAVKEQFVELRARGLSFTGIAKELQVSKQTLMNWSRDLSLEIRNRRAIEFEALLEMHALTREKRIEAIGQLLKRMNQELAARPLTEIPTERLLDSILKLMAESEAVGSELSFGAEGNVMELLNKDLETTVTHWSA
jgi:hypothetical protein